MLTMAGGLLFLAGARGWLAGPRGIDELAPLVLASTVAATAVVGAFDAVLLLPVPALFVWSLLGTLLPVDPFPERRPAGWRSRTAFALSVMALGAALTWRSVQQVRAMELIAVWGRLSTRAEAAAMDPGSYRIQVMVAQSYRRRGRCKEAIPFAQQAAGLFPDASEPRAILRACGAR